MKTFTSKLAMSALVGASLLSLAACQSTDNNQASAAKSAEKQAVKVVKKALNNNDMFEVSHEGRYFIFDDFATYQQFLSVGETAYRKVYIGDGPHGETLVFGLTGKDKKKSSGIAGIDMYRGNLNASDDFYGEIRSEDGRLYVFSHYEDMVETRKLGDAIYRFTQIGAGPDGQTVVFVLNKDNKKKRPDALIAEFKKRNKLG
ncbi:MAG: hypothetical protein ACPGR2_00545 [Psychrobium sp.]